MNQTAKRLLGIWFGIVCFFGGTVAQDKPYGGIRLLDGYKFKRSNTFDTVNGTIYKDRGLSIEFESGISEGYAADPKHKGDFIWFREQTINGHKVFCALAKFGSVPWRPDTPRDEKSARILIVTFPQRFGGQDAANFYTEVLNDQEIAEALLMILTFDPDK